MTIWNRILLAIIYLVTILFYVFKIEKINIGEKLKNWFQLNKGYLYSVAATVIIISIFIAILVIPWNCESSLSRNLEPIILEEGKVQDALKEMEILSNFLMDNGQQIMLIRQIMVGILATIAAYILMEESKKDGIKFYGKKYEIFLIMFFVFFSTLVIESVIQITQTALTNRIYQLEQSINEEIISSCTNKLQDVFAAKERFYYEPSSISRMLLRLIWAPTFSLFYLFTFIFILLLQTILKEKTTYAYPRNCGQ